MFTPHTIAKALGSIALALVCLLGAANAAQAIDTTHRAYAAISGRTSIPVGHAEFCKSRPGECMPHAKVVEAVTLTPENWDDLVRVNAYYNQAIVAVSDMDLYGIEEFWTYPNGYGDCEDIALIKRRDLIERGWPASTLLITVVKQANGEGHAILMVRTDRGDLVLDNQAASIEVWADTPYSFLKRQSQANAGEWVDIFDSRAVAVASAR